MKGSQLRLPLCQRWRKRRDSYRPAGEPIDPRRYSVEPIAHSEGKAFVEAHHYSGTWPAVRFAVGMFEAGQGLVGVAAFSQPMNQATVPSYIEGLDPQKGIELGRFVLLDRVPANGESFAIARALRLLREARPEVVACLSFSDPLPRFTAEKRLVKYGHQGTAYRASAASYLGRSKPKTILVGPDGRDLSPRTLSKIRRGERGGRRGDYGPRQLMAMGAPVWRTGESGEAWVERVKASGALRSLRHPGNLAYCFAVGDRKTRRTVRSRLDALPYPVAA